MPFGYGPVCLDKIMERLGNVAPQRHKVIGVLGLDVQGQLHTPDDPVQP